MFVPTTTPYYRLKLKSLKFISAVDAGAQGPVANVALIKRAGADERVEATCRVVKVDEHLGLVFGWALASSLDGGASPHVDLQQDAIIGDDELIKIAADFMEQGAASDVMHDDNPDGKIVFCMPLTKDVSSALGIATKVHGLAIAMRPSKETFRRFVAKELNAFSIAGTGIRELVKSATAEPCGTCGGPAVKTADPKCPGCSAYGKADDKGNCPSCGKAMKRARRPTVSTLKAALTTADRDALPDSSFFYIEPGGSKDADGKTTPRSHRMFPYRDSTGTIDIAHLRTATQDIPKSSLAKDLQSKLQIRAEKLLGQQHGKRLRKQAVLTSSVDGHQHQIDLDDPADGWSDQLTTSFNNAAGADQGHCHAWIYDATTGAITIAEDSGHMHAVDAVVPADAIAQAKLNDSGTRCPGCSEMCEEGCRFCPKCGCAMDRSCGAPVSPTADGDGGSGPNVMLIAARAPAAISTPAEGVSTVKGDKELTAMADQTDHRIRALEAENAQLKKMASMTDAHRVHVAKLSEADALNFINLTPSQRDTMLAEVAKADEVVYESPYTKRVYRKSSPLEIVEAAREADASKAALEQLQADRRDHEFGKRGEQTLSQFAKGAKSDLRARIMKAIGTEFTVPAEYEEAVKALKGANVALEMLMKMQGSSQADEPTGELPPKAALEKLAAEYAKANNVPIYKAHVAVLDTAEGAALYAKLPVGRA